MAERPIIKLEITPELLKSWSNRDLAVALKFVAMVTGDIEAARVCKEAAERLTIGVVEVGRLSP